MPPIVTKKKSLWPLLDELSPPIAGPRQLYATPIPTSAATTVPPTGDVPVDTRVLSDFIDRLFKVKSRNKLKESGIE